MNYRDLKDKAEAMMIGEARLSVIDKEQIRLSNERQVLASGLTRMKEQIKEMIK